jgi:hypothetical protein
MKASRTPVPTDLFYPTLPGVLDSVCTLLQRDAPVPAWSHGFSSTTRSRENLADRGWQLLYLNPPFNKSLDMRACTGFHTPRVQTGGKQ